MKRAALAVFAALLAAAVVAGGALSANQRPRHDAGLIGGIFGPFPAFTFGSDPFSVHLDLHGSNSGERLTIDAGKIVAVSGDQLTISEHVSGETQTVTVNVAGFRIVRNGAVATAGALREGDQVLVFTSPLGFVAARS